MNEVEGRVALVTGAGAGIGEGIAARSLPGERRWWSTTWTRKPRAGSATRSLRAAAGPRDIANGVLFFASDASSYVTGQTIHICGGKSLSTSYQ